MGNPNGRLEEGKEWKFHSTTGAPGLPGPSPAGQSLCPYSCPLPPGAPAALGRNRPPAAELHLLVHHTPLSERLTLGSHTLPCWARAEETRYCCQ